MSWLNHIKQMFNKKATVRTTNSKKRVTRVVEIACSGMENRCPVCGNMLSKNLSGTVEIKCKRCKNIIILTQK